MKESHIALIVSPNDSRVVGIPWLVEPSNPRHSGFTDEEQRIMEHYHNQWREYHEVKKIAVPCDMPNALRILGEQHPDRKVLPHISSHYNVVGITLSELLGKPKRNPEKGDSLTCAYSLLLPGNEIKPKLEQQKEYRLKDIVLDKKGNLHFDVGLKSYHNYIRSYETGEELPNGNKIHWCHSLRFIW